MTRDRSGPLAKHSRPDATEVDKMISFKIFGTTLLLACTTVNAQADVRAEIPADYPSHKKMGSCQRQALSEHLQHYNETRLDVASVLRHMADEKKASTASRERLIGYAANLENMRQDLPPPDPDSKVFQNFDFQLGITLTSMTLFLNTEDEHLAQRFISDRDNPDSRLGQYLTRLEDSRKSYMDLLASARSGDCKG